MFGVHSISGLQTYQNREQILCSQRLYGSQNSLFKVTLQTLSPNSNANKQAAINEVFYLAVYARKMGLKPRAVHSECTTERHRI